MQIELIKSDAPRPLANYNECFKVGPWVFAAGQIASDYQTGVPAQARRNPAFPFYGSDIKLQTHYVLGNLKKRSRRPAARSITSSRRRCS